jgi:hypothetical protein
MRPTFSHMSDTEAEDAPAPVVRAPTPDRTLDGLRRRKKKTNRYHLFSDTDGEQSSALSSAETEPEQDIIVIEPPPPNYSDLEMDGPTPRAGPAEEDSYFPRPAWEAESWIAFALIPQYVSATVAPQSWGVAALNALTPHRELCAADAAVDPDAAFERARDRLRAEWYGVGASLIALAGLDAAVFGFAQGGAFADATDGASVRLVALSAAATGLGLCSAAWLLLLHASADAQAFARAARDVLGGFALFSVSARVPAALLAASAAALTGFLVRVAWAAWPAATLALCALVGVLTGLQWLVWGVHAAARVVVWAVKGVRRVALRAAAPRARSVEEGAPEEEKTPRPAAAVPGRPVAVALPGLVPAPRPVVAPLSLPESAQAASPPGLPGPPLYLPGDVRAVLQARALAGVPPPEGDAVLDDEFEREVLFEAKLRELEGAGREREWERERERERVVMEA